MPLLTRLFVKLALLWLVVAMAAQAAAAWTPPGATTRGLQVAAFHALAVGWLTQMVFGVAIWMFPKRKGDAPRGSDLLGRWVLLLLNVGVALRLAAEPVSTRGGGWAWAFVAAGVAQLGAAIGFALLVRGRIRG